MRKLNKSFTISQNQQFTIFQVLQYVENNIHKKHQLNELAAMVSYSPFHFHRLFKSVIGVNLNEYIANYRLQKVTHYLKFYPHLSLTEIAELTGFSSLNDLSRKFKAYYGQTATQAREGFTQNRKICIMNRKISERYFNVNYYNEIQGDGRSAIREERTLRVTIKSLPQYRAIFHPLLGSDATHFQSSMIQAFQQINRTMSGSSPRSFQNLFIGKIHYGTTINEDLLQWRYDACITIPMDWLDHEVPTTLIPGGSYAVLRLMNNPDDKKAVLDAFYQEWLPTSGYSLSDRPCLEIFGSAHAFQPGFPPFVDYCIPLLI
ncbi:AraC family transcriptional regulator [Paenibacillus xylaniclasticus]|uniref:AraC family transcriptional regulator n=1 Tax=Paenibacillus xylaniclasticus TaxID=588083 RepID=UPI000FD8EE4B|nr:helix-turn-helix domain-containing protein [Paenibacillus xylaniclasticus]